MPSVSVIIPNYNHAIFLKRRIDSIIEQIYQDFELIILDDCSTDNSREIIENYRGNSKINHIEYNQNNSGSPFKQWQKGIANAKGQFIWIAESDDDCEPGFLKEMMQAFEQNENLVLAHCQLLCIRNEQVIWRSSTDRINKVTNGVDFNINNLLNKNGIENASGVVFKKDAFLKIESKYLDMKFCGDWYTWSQICRQGAVFTSGKYLNYFIKHDSDVSGGAILAGLDFKEGIDIMLEIIAREKPNTSYIKATLDYRLIQLEDMKYKFSDKDSYPYIKKILLNHYKNYGFDVVPQTTIIQKGKLAFIKRFKTLKFSAKKLFI